MKLAKLSALLLAMAACSSAQAAGVGIRAGTTGIGADFGWNVAPTLNGRVGYSAFSYNTHIDTDVRYNTKLKLSNLNAFIDWSPFLGTFRFTGGVIANDNRYDLTGTGSTYTINGRTYQSSDAGSFGGAVKSGRQLAPYLGVGWGNVAGAGVNFYADLGIMFMGSPKASLSASCASSLSPGQCAQLQSDVAAERARLEDRLHRFKYYPVANIGVTIGF
jgi:hypothetical protein